MIHIPAMQHLRKANNDRRQRTGTEGKWEFSANILKKERSYATHKKVPQLASFSFQCTWIARLRWLWGNLTFVCRSQSFHMEDSICPRAHDGNISQISRLNFVLLSVLL